MNNMELGTFSFTYRSLGVHGMGISSSSNFAVLYEASQLYLQNGPPLAPEEVARAALRFERRWEANMAVAADDVYPITYGGVRKVITGPNTRKNGGIVDGQVTTEAVDHDPRWIAEHVVVAFDPRGTRHKVQIVLADLFEDKAAAVRYVKQFSGYADKACAAIKNRDCVGLAAAVNAYRDGFNEWTKGKHIGNVEAEARQLKGLRVLGWKPPGAGASRSLIVITPDAEASAAVIQFFQNMEWWASPAYVTSGICGEFIKANGDIRITAGHRLDFVGAADLGQDIRIGAPGRCCSCAIEPRTEMLLSATRPRREPGEDGSRNGLTPRSG